MISQPEPVGTAAGRQRREWRSVLAHMASFLVAALLLASACAHIFNPYRYLNSILEYRLVSARVAVVAAAFLPFIQLVLGVVFLFLPTLRRSAAIGSAILFSMFLFAQLSAIVRRLDISCGCFGADGMKIGALSIGIACGGLLLSLIGSLARTRAPNRGCDSVHRQGFTLMELIVVIAILSILLGLILSAVQNVRAAAAKADCQNRMKQIGVALHQYHQTRGALPAGLSVQLENGKYPYLGWTARILPYLDHQSLSNEVDRAFASDPNPLVFYGHAPHAKILATPVVDFTCPSDGRIPGPSRVGSILAAHTSYLGLEGTNQFLHDGILYLDSNIRFADIQDGTSQTLSVGERPPSSDLRLGWWYRGWGQVKDGSAEMILGVRERNVTRPGCPTTGHQFSPGSIQNLCDLFHFWSLHSGGANFAFADGSVRFLRYSSNEILPALATRAGGESDAILE